jgi:hypothetical protein
VLKRGVLLSWIHSRSSAIRSGLRHYLLDEEINGVVFGQAVNASGIVLRMIVSIVVGLRRASGSSSAVESYGIVHSASQLLGLPSRSCGY